MTDSAITYEIRSLDVWGHVHADCERDCRCAPNATGIGTERDCECDQQVNDSNRLGELTVPRDGTDKTILRALVEEGYLVTAALSRCYIDDMSTAGADVMVCDADGRWLYNLVMVEE